MLQHRKNKLSHYSKALSIVNIDVTDNTDVYFQVYEIGNLTVMN